MTQRSIYCSYGIYWLLTGGVMELTKTALGELRDVLKENEGKSLRVVFKGFG